MFAKSNDQSPESSRRRCACFEKFEKLPGFLEIRDLGNREMFHGLFKQNLQAACLRGSSNNLGGSFACRFLCDFVQMDSMEL